VIAAKEDIRRFLTTRFMGNKRL